ncbi:DUF5694 domain-containing protein [Halobacillus litoralis]|uniref:DUF5694 domain-containing protein n=1 Tax=Halobacillus litoralis TaxID=45668 RepID=UPI001CD70251|nr:DUF5694 domain-containing protein [Halobacillus litoralis]MCA0971896.1 DUF5694 domain-containing protein [Halobacillus litoralis]
MKKPDVLLVGMVHMAVEPSLVNEHQDEIRKINEALAAFEPNKIAVEKSFYVEEEMNRRYNEFINGQIPPAYDEVEQFGFQIAKKAELPELHAVDEIVDMSTPSLEEVFEWAKQHQPHLFKDIVHTHQELQAESGQHGTFLGKLQAMNEDHYLERMRQLYMKIAKVGDRQHSVGVHWLKQWHHRDLAITANVLRLADPGERILVFTGGDHLHLLKQLISDSQEVNLMSLGDFL